MHVDDLARSAWQSLQRTRGRSMLTMLGIVIGIAAVILALSIGDAAQNFILAQVSSFGSDKLIIHPGPKTQTDNPSPFTEQSITIKDVKRLKKETWLSGVSAEIMQTDLLQANGVNKNVTVLGTFPDEIVIGGYATADGVFLSDADIESHARVAVLGKKIAEDVFGQERPIGKTIKIGKNGYRVIGVMKEIGTQFFFNMDELVFVPATNMTDVYGKKYYEYIYVKTAIPLDEATRRIEGIMRDTHGISNPDGDPVKDDFFVMTQADAIKVVDQITSVLQILLASIAAISLLVGGIGIMNIMYVSVTERVSEIGLRKAVGANRRDVLGQFLTEAVMLTVAGGAIGLVVGLLLSWLGIQVINYYSPGWAFVVSWVGVALGIGVSTVIGLTFGYLPARKAAGLHPIEALRQE